MSRIALIAVLALFACSKSKPADESHGSASTPPPSVADAASVVVADAPPPADAAEGSAGGSASGSGAGSAAESDWDKLPHDDKVKVMKTKVMPAMKTAFQNYDAKKYAGFNCKTCHGKDAQKNKFKMPNAELPKLDFAALKAGKNKKAAEFMAKTVKPEMAKILGMPEMTETNDGFGCLDCHVQKK